MRDQWYGDHRDLAKWAVLVQLAEKFQIGRILQVAYYRPSEWPDIEIDGTRRPIPDAVLSHFRAIGQAAGLRAPCRIDVLDAPFVDRNAYADLVRRAVSACTDARQLVFLDPDTGLAPSKAGWTHVTDAEVAAVWRLLRQGDVLVLYQHQTNRNGQAWIEPKRLQFEAALGAVQGKVRVARADRLARDVVFLFSEKAG
jgi:hypothetical protein